MKELNLQIKNIDGETVEEKTITFSEGDKFILQFNKSVNREEMHRTSEIIEEWLSGKRQVLVLPEYLTFYVVNT